MVLLMDVSLSAQSNRFVYRPALPNPQKIICVLFVFVLSWYSGTVDASKFYKTKSVFIPQNTPRLLSANQAAFFPKAEIPADQVRIIQVTRQKKIPPPASTPQDSQNPILQALNAYRQKHNKSALVEDEKLAAYAQMRAQQFAQQKNLDNHAGFLDFINNQDGFRKLNFSHLGENSGYGYSVSAQSLIEDVYGHSPAHDNNQLSDQWSHVGIGVSGTATDIIFGGR